MNIENKVELKGALIGMIYGDGSWKNRNALIISGTDIEYMKWKAGIMENVTSVNWYEEKLNTGHYGRKQVYVVSGKTHPIYERLRMRTCHNERKAITEYAMRTITPLGLLFWYLDDGCLDDASGLKFQIHSNSFTEIEHQYIQKILNDRFGLRFNIRKSFKKKRGKTYYWLYLKGSDRIKFFETVIEPYWDLIPETMKYKCSTKRDIESKMLSKKHKRFYKDIV